MTSGVTELLLSFITCVSLLAQTAGPLVPRHAAERTPGGKLKVNAELVLINAVVTDHEDHFVWDLRSGQFRVFEEKSERPVTSVTQEDGPVSVGIIFDTSRSMNRDFDQVKAATLKLIGRLRDDDEAFLIRFSDHPEMIAPPGTAFEQMAEAVSASRAAKGTAFLDAVVMGLGQLRTARYRRRALVIVSDGIDMDSRRSWREVRSMIREADVRIFPLIISFDLDAYGYEQAEFESFAEDSGGRAFFIRRANSMAGVIERLSMHRQYILAYRPPAREPDGKYRRVRVVLDSAPKGWRVYWKHGYFTPVPYDYGSTPNN